MATTITKNFSLEELCASDVAKAKKINNTPGTQAVVNLVHLTVNVLQPLRDWYGKPILIGSGYRSAALNKAVGGVRNSQHMEGKAVDLYIEGDRSKGWCWFKYIRDHLLFDQLIWEHNAKGTYWVHVSFNRGYNRKQVISDMTK